METVDSVPEAGAGLPQRRSAFGAIRDAFLGPDGLLVNPYFYLGLMVLIAGIQQNFQSQVYLHNYVSTGKTLPKLSDMILDNLPYWDISQVYDLFSLGSLIAFAVYVVHRRTYKEVPYYLLLCGIFHLIRGIFIVLTPFDHPALFVRTNGIFHGFSKFEMGLFPSGHAGISFLYLLLVRGWGHRLTQTICLLAIIGALFLSRGHYSIDVLSGLFFAYAIKAFGDKHLSSRFTAGQIAQM